jgi:hypothetical protein
MEISFSHTYNPARSVIQQTTLVAQATRGRCAMAILVAPTGGVRAHQRSRSLRPVQSASFPSGDRLVGPSTTGRTWTTLCPRTRPDVVGASVQRGAMQPPARSPGGFATCITERLPARARRCNHRVLLFRERARTCAWRAKRSSVEHVMLSFAR